MKFKWFFNLINLCAVALIAVSIFVLMTVVMTPAGQVPEVMGFSILQVLTGSMEPTIPEGSMLLIRRTDPNTLTEGDIISFYSPDPSLDGALNTHRIVGVDQSGEELRFTTKGDANFWRISSMWTPSGSRARWFISPLPWASWSGWFPIRWYSVW